MLKYLVILLFILLPDLLANATELESLFVDSQRQDDISFVLKILEENLGEDFSNKPEDCIELANMAYEISDSLNNHEHKAIALRAIGHCYNQSGNYDICLEYYFKAYLIFEERKILNQSLFTNLLIGKTYEVWGKPELAEDYFKNSLKTSKELNDNVIQAEASLLLGEISIKKKRNTSAVNFLNNSLKLYLSLTDSWGISRCNTYLAKANFEIGKKAKIRTVQKQPEIETRTQTRESKINVDLGVKKDLNESVPRVPIIKTRYYNPKNNPYYRKALSFLHKSMGIAKENVYSSIMQDNYILYYEIHTVIGNFQQAMENYKAYSQLKEQIFNEKRQKSIDELFVKYETEKKDKENELLKKDQEIKELELNEEKYYRNFFIITIVFLIILVITMFVLNFYRRKTYKLLSEKNEELQRANSLLQKSERNLRKLNATKDKFFSIIAHDLQNPINAFIGMSELISNRIDTLKKEQIREFTIDFKNSAKGLGDLLENLLQWSSTQTGGLRLFPTKIDIAEVAERNLKFLKNMAKEKHIHIISKVKPDTIGFADFNVIVTVVRNIMINALKFTSENGSIEIDANSEGEYVEITISDNGMGISQADQNKLFRIDIANQDIGAHKNKGTGLGLILCKEFVESSGGRIWVESHFGFGSKFSFTIPKDNSNK